MSESNPQAAATAVGRIELPGGSFFKRGGHAPERFFLHRPNGTVWAREGCMGWFTEEEARAFAAALRPSEPATGSGEMECLWSDADRIMINTESERRIAKLEGFLPFEQSKHLTTICAHIFDIYDLTKDRAIRERAVAIKANVADLAEALSRPAAAAPSASPSDVGLVDAYGACMAEVCHASAYGAAEVEIAAYEQARTALLNRLATLDDARGEAQVPDELRKLSKATTQGPWESDVTNSDDQLIETENDEDYCYCWDSQGERNVSLAVAAVNFVRSLLAPPDRPGQDEGGRTG